MQNNYNFWLKPKTQKKEKIQVAFSSSWVGLSKALLLPHLIPGWRKKCSVPAWILDRAWTLSLSSKPPFFLWPDLVTSLNRGWDTKEEKKKSNTIVWEAVCGRLLGGWYLSHALAYWPWMVTSSQGEGYGKLLHIPLITKAPSGLDKPVSVLNLLQNNSL